VAVDDGADEVACSTDVEDVVGGGACAVVTEEELDECVALHAVAMQTTPTAIARMNP
jgi:hypothetical protein